MTLGLSPAWNVPSSKRWPYRSNLVLGMARSLSSFFQDAAMTTPALDGDPVGAATDVGSGLDNHLLGSGGTRPILTPTGLRYGDGGLSDVLTSVASAASDFAIYVRCTAQTGGSGILFAESPQVLASPFANIYALQTFFSVNASFAPLVADPGGEQVRGMTLNGSTLRGFLGLSTGTASVTPAGFGAISLGCLNPDAYVGTAFAIGVYNEGHNLAQIARVSSFLLGL